jgi:hypothetical protein
MTFRSNLVASSAGLGKASFGPYGSTDKAMHQVLETSDELSVMAEQRPRSSPSALDNSRIVLPSRNTGAVTCSSAIRGVSAS